MPAYLGSSLYRIGRRLVLAIGDSIGVNVETVSANVTLSAQSSVVQFINGGASDRNVALPVDAALVGGLQFIKNTGTTNNLVVKYDSTTIATLAPGEWVICASVTGLVWYAAAFSSTLTNRTTTTDGVASGDARIVGGISHAKITTTTVTNTTSETTAASHSIPANTIKSGTTVRIRGAIKCTGNAGGHTATLRVKLGSVELINTGALNMVANDVAEFEAVVSGRATPGASVALSSLARAIYQQSATASSAVAVKDAATYTGQATNGALVASATIQWSAASASDIVTCDQFTVEVIG